MRGHPVLLNRAPTLHRLGIQAFQPEGLRFVYIHYFFLDSMQNLMGIKWLFMYLYLWRLKQRLVYLSIGDPISIPTQDMLIELYVLTSGNRQDLIHGITKIRKMKELTIIIRSIQKNPFFVIPMMDAIGAYRQKRINLDSPLWLRWRLDQRVITSSEAPIEVHYESLGTYHEIYGHYLIVRSVKKEILFIYKRTTVGHIYLYQEISEAIQGFCRACSYGT
ncbi:hypothetical protein Cgig2_019190 [Carnegiea gigantea]|uniref:DNA-directed RNA polymerase n=1 Tax=Carnegiea gigantea TaxID=171969 RepID=A0A9Q1K3H2_9CARY|nr:hypothetical protein Cgig2_019190 [Carnegiea gigantea]